MAKQPKSLAPIDNRFLAIGRSRAIIEHVSPELDSGLYPVKRIENEWFSVEADVFTDGHDLVTAYLLYRKAGDKKWQQVLMSSLGNDRWQGGFQCDSTGNWEYTIKAFVNHAATWQHAYHRRLTDNDPKEWQVQLLIGVDFLKEIQKAYPKSKAAAQDWIKKLSSDKANEYAVSKDLEAFLEANPLIHFETIYDKVLRLVVHRQKAGFSAWYSFFPRSAAPEGKAHGTFADCEKLLPRLAEMGFDVVYFPPIHPIGESFRKGKNNSLNAQPDDYGCPYATGLGDKGHKDILPELGTLKDFKKFIKAAADKGMEVAMDFAIQCSPDHPYVKDNPQWFKWRPDGTVQYAENPPKKYQDVLPVDYESEDWQNLWMELKSILEYWIAQGIKIFRVDNPHTKSFIFWEWCMSEIAKTNPEVIFLSEAFTRPRIMENLAKKGFHQSYTYYTWRNNKWELAQYMQELTHTEMKEYFRPNFWPNTHDINPYILQSGHEPQYMIRFFMAATLSSNYGIFGPVYELMQHDAMPGKEEYLDSEKYEVRHWDWEKRNKLMYLIGMVNKIRNENIALQFTSNYETCTVHNDHLYAYLKVYGDNKILCIVNLDAWNRQSGTVHVPLNLIGKQGHESYVVHDLLTGEKYTWTGEANYVELDPYRLPCHLFRIENL